MADFNKILTPGDVDGGVSMSSLKYQLEAIIKLNGTENEPYSNLIVSSR